MGIKTAPMKVVAVGVEDYPPRFTVARPFADNLRPSDVVTFKPHKSEASPLWSKTWRIVRVEKHMDDTKKIYVAEVL